jgi:formylglycine-generating enzyme required for sulfatase activity
MGRFDSEGPQQKVTIAKPFALAEFEQTFREWDTCVAYGGCDPHLSDAGWGRDQRPAIYVTWDDAQRYAAWLSKMTGKPYRLLSEAEYEYAARAGTQTAYPWGDNVGNNNANCIGCGSRWDNSQTSQVGSFAANAFGLHDMVGNIWEWTEDCYHPSYEGAPADGSAWTSGDCSLRSIRGGSWNSPPAMVRSATRRWNITTILGYRLGFRVARTIEQ